jgi:PIN domain nuclease of toxin-antitoxin system
MKFLIDSHIALWLIYEPERVPGHVIDALRQPNAARLLSDVTLLELSIKLSKGKLEYSNDLASLTSHLDDLSSTYLPIRREHILASAALPRIHGDPFDRLIIAQAILEDAVLVTDDDLIRKYEVKTL